MQQLLRFLERLKSVSIHYTLAHHRDEAVMVLISVPGERWEVEFLNDGTIEVEIFRGDGAILEDEALADLFARFSD